MAWWVDFTSLKQVHRFANMKIFNSNKYHDCPQHTVFLTSCEWKCGTAPPYHVLKDLRFQATKQEPTASEMSFSSACSKTIKNLQIIFSYSAEALKFCSIKRPFQTIQGYSRYAETTMLTTGNIARAYALPKIHKPILSLRIIVFWIDWLRRIFL